MSLKTPSVLPLATLLLSATRTVLSIPVSNGDAKLSSEPTSGVLETYDRAAVVDWTGGNWRTEVIIGGIKLNLIVDTGSADLWVFGPSLASPGNHNVYDYTKTVQMAGKANSQPLMHQDSPTQSPAPVLFDIAYWDSVDSRVQGYVVQEPRVSVGGAQTPMAVEVATHVGKGWKDAKVDGILGLGFKTNNRVSVQMNATDAARPLQMPTLMEWLQFPGVVDPMVPTENVFTVDFNPDGAGQYYQPTIEIGKIDHNKYTGKLGHTPVNNDDGAWNVDDVMFSVNGVFIDHRQQMLFDTGGANQITVDRKIARAYYAYFGPTVQEHPDGSFTVPCQGTWPDLTMHLGNSTATYTGSAIKPNTTDATCNGILIGNNGTNVGAPFFQTYYTAFNYSEPAVLWAPFSPTY